MAAASLIGEAAIASAKVAYSIYQQIFRGDRYQALVARGARPQRLLWASTSTKDPAYPDVKYVEPLIGPMTVNTLPVETLKAYRDHGDPAARLAEGLEQAAAVLQRLPALGIDLNQATQQLEDEGVEKFNQPYDHLLGTLEGKRREALGESKESTASEHQETKMNLTTLFLDIGGVLLTNGWDRRMRQAAAEKFNLDQEEMNERHHLTFDTYEEGKLSLDEYLTRLVFYEDRALHPGRLQGLYVRPVPAAAGNGPNRRTHQGPEGQIRPQGGHGEQRGAGTHPLPHQEI